MACPPCTPSPTAAARTWTPSSPDSACPTAPESSKGHNNKIKMITTAGVRPRRLRPPAQARPPRARSAVHDRGSVTVFGPGTAGDPEPLFRRCRHSSAARYLVEAKIEASHPLAAPGSRNLICHPLGAYVRMSETLGSGSGIPSPDASVPNMYTEIQLSRARAAARWGILQVCRAGGCPVEYRSSHGDTARVRMVGRLRFTYSLVGLCSVPLVWGSAGSGLMFVSGLRRRPLGSLMRWFHAGTTSSGAYVPMFWATVLRCSGGGAREHLAG
jgi:hypothetical protein